MIRRLMFLMTGCFCLIGCTEQRPLLSDKSAAPQVSTGSDPIVARVNGQEIKKSTLVALLVRARGKGMLDELILSEIIRQKAGKMGITPSAEATGAELDRVLGDMARDKSRQHQLALLDYMLKSRHMSRREFDLILERQSLLRRMVDSNIVVSEDLLEQEFQQRYGAKVQVRQITVSSLRQIESAQRKLNEGVDFLTLVKEMSQDQATLGAEGLLGPFSRIDEQILLKIRQGAFELERIGQRSDIISYRDSEGMEWWSILQLEKIIAASNVSLADVRDELTEAISQQQITGRMMELQRKCQSQAKVERFEATLSRGKRIMGLIFHSQVDRDFPGGIYLNPLGKTPAVNRIESPPYEGELHLPLSTAGGATMEVVVDKGQSIEAGTLLAKGDGHFLYAPREGVVGDEINVWAYSKPDQRALVLQSVQSSGAMQKIPSAVDMPSQTGKQAVYQAIEKSGIIDPYSSDPLATTLGHFDKEKVTAVVANAAGLEPSLNGTLAILDCFAEQVFAGLAILKTALNADRAIMAYPYNFDIDLTIAKQWEVQCVPISEKYPQARRSSVLHTLTRQGHLPRTRRRELAAVVFDIQLLRLVERLILAGQVPTERIVTICGDGIAKPGHFLVPLGLGLREMLKWVGIYEDSECVVEGSSLAGVPIDPDHAVIAPTTEAFTVIRRLPHRRSQRCIRCGWCINYCPAEIDPAELLHLAETGQYHLAAQNGALACLECGICSYVCPAQLRIMEHLRLIKRKLK